MKTTKPFTLGQILSITTGRLCCDMDGVYDILNHVTGDDLFTHVLPRASRFARPLILAEHPELERAGTAEAIKSLNLWIVKSKAEGPIADVMWGIKKWMNELHLPDSLDVASAADSWLSFDPVTERFEAWLEKTR